MTPRKLAPGIALLAGLAACQGEKPSPPETPPPPAAVASAPAAQTEVPAVFVTPKDDYFYNPVGKRDPFKQFEGESFKDVNLPKAPLERYDLDELVPTAIVWGVADPRALVRAPDGYSYIVRANTRLGKNRGRVSRITRREVFVEEEYRDPNGRLVVRESSLKMRPKEKEGENEKQKLQMSDE